MKKTKEISVHRITEQPNFSVTNVWVHSSDSLSQNEKDQRCVWKWSSTTCHYRNISIGYFQNFWGSTQLPRSQKGLTTTDWRCCNPHQLCFGKRKSGQCGNGSQEQGSECDKGIAHEVQVWDINKLFPFLGLAKNKVFYLPSKMKNQWRKQKYLIFFSKNWKKKRLICVSLHK